VCIQLTVLNFEPPDREIGVVKMLIGADVDVCYDWVGFSVGSDGSLPNCGGRERQIEGGRRNVSLLNILKLAHGLKVRPTKLIETIR
jgi:hypothetical protein